MTDVDIDFFDRGEALKLIDHIPASQIVNGEYKKHVTGVYPHVVPINPLTGNAAFDYKEADKRGYFKIDFLNVSAYKGVRNEQHLVQLQNTEPMWELFLEKTVVDSLAHVNGHSHLLSFLKPRSVEELAAAIALIRPGKKHLINKYVTHGYQAIASELWEYKDSDQYSFKKSHAIGYALLIVVQLNQLCEVAASA